MGTYRGLGLEEISKEQTWLSAALVACAVATAGMSMSMLEWLESINSRLGSG